MFSFSKTGCFFRKNFLHGGLFPVILFTAASPVWAAEEEAPATPDWVISFSVMLLFLSLAIAILLRPTKRPDTAFTADELREQREAEKKKSGHH
jgi:multisubunit Na+/H+ antiporter MnhB subunit